MAESSLCPETSETCLDTGLVAGLDAALARTLTVSASECNKGS